MSGSGTDSNMRVHHLSVSEIANVVMAAMSVIAVFQQWRGSSGAKRQGPKMEQVSDDVHAKAATPLKTITARRAVAWLFTKKNRVSLAFVIMQFVLLIAFAASDLEVTPYRAVMTAVFVANIYGTIAAWIAAYQRVE